MDLTNCPLSSFAVCAGAAAASAANKNAQRQYKYQLDVRERKHYQKLSIYNAGKVQFEKTLSNIHQGLNASYDRAQLKLNRMRGKFLSEGQNALGKLLQNSKYGNLLSSGMTGRSLDRLGVLEYGALGRFYAQKASALTDAREDFMRGTKLSRFKAKTAQESAFAKTAFQPVEDVAPPVPVMQNVALAFFNDALNIAGSVAGIQSQWSDSRLKKNIKKIGNSIDGYNIYKFEYLDDDKEWIGVLAEEVFKKKPSAVVRMDNGFLGVDYHQIDVEFKEVVKS